MSIPKKTFTYLDKNKIKYDVLKHKPVYTTFDLAATLKKKLNEIVKTLLVKADKKYVLVALPAHYKLDFAKLKKALKVKKVQLAAEKMMKKTFKVKPGTISPFGNLHKVEVLVDEELTKLRDAIIRAGSYTESLRLKVRDYLDLEKPKRAKVGKK